MSDGLTLNGEMKAVIDADVARRTAAHKAEVARLKAGRSFLSATLKAARPEPLCLLANGDSWFDYPLLGNSFPGQSDIIHQLKSMGKINPLPLSVAHWGDATTDEMALPKQERMIEALNDPDNWSSSGKPDAILFSGGGNDIAGDRFCIYLDFNDGVATGLNQQRFNGVLASIEASYLDLFAFRDQYAPGVPIFGHDYDFPIPNGKHPVCTGAWLKPSLVFRGWTDVTIGAGIVKDALTQFKGLVTRLAVPANNFHLVPTQGTLKPGDWANELHPEPDGFKKVAEKFVAALSATFPGRI